MEILFANSFAHSGMHICVTGRPFAETQKRNRETEGERMCRCRFSSIFGARQPPRRQWANCVQWTHFFHFYLDLEQRQ